MYADLFWDRDEAEHQKFLDNLAPIVLFTYNRLEHTRQTIEALKANVYAAESRLFIFSDAPKNEQAEPAVQAVRDYLHSVDGFKEIQIIQRDENWGLARNIMDGVTSIVNRYGKIIVLEDDIVTSKWFLKYMNDALKIYKNEPRVMEISGYQPAIDKEDLSETFFLHFGDCWGWATWARAWAFFERNPEQLMQEFSDEDIYHFNFEGAMDFWSQVVQNYDGKLYTWAVFWQASIMRRNGLMLATRDSLTDNVGLDGSGENCGAADSWRALRRERAITVFPLAIEESILGRQRLKTFFMQQNNNWKTTMRNKIKRFWDMIRDA